MSKPGFTLDRHDAAGIVLSQMHNDLGRLYVDLGNAYPGSAKAVKLVERAQKAVDALRCELDNVVCRERPDYEDAIRVYYRPREDERQSVLADNARSAPGTATQPSSDDHGSTGGTRVLAG